MKKQLFVILFVIIGITIVGCQVTVGAKEDIELDSMNHNELSTITEYYPFLKNTLLGYKGGGIEYAEQTVYYEFIDGNKAQQKIVNSGTNLIKILENNDGILAEVYVEGEFYHIENMINTKSDKSNIVLKEPLIIGNSWLTADGYKREITGLDVEVETPYKKFEALEVTTTLEDGNYRKEYYAKGIGLVARMLDYGDHQVETLLKSIKEEPLMHEILTYYPLFSEAKTVFVEDKISFYTNQSIEKLLEDKLKNVPSSKLIAPLSKGTVINSIHLDRSSWVVKADFSKELLTEMNAGSTLETEILKSIINTLGKFYDTDKVYISVEGIPYESGHYAIKEDENFTVNIDGIEKFK